MKKIIKTTILLTTIFSLCFGFKVVASIEADRASEGIESAGCTLYQIVSSSPYGNYTKIVDECGNDALVNTYQWNEYKALVAQGFPEVIMVDAGWSDETFYAIQGYQLAGQPKVDLPKDKLIKVNDTFNCDHLSILKRVSGQLNSSQYLFNQTKKEQEMKENNARINAERAKQQAEAIADQQQIDLNNQINAELNMNASTLPYTLDYIKNYRDSQEEISHNKVWASFDNERNDIQQWLTAHGFKSMQELKDYAYKTGVTHYGLQEQVAIQYCKYVEEGKCSTIGDYIRLKFKENHMAMWNQLEKWNPGKGDYGILPKGSKTKLICYEDEYKYNLEICKMIEANMPIIANYTHLNKEEKTKLIEQFLNSFDEISKATYVKNIVKGYESRTELMNKLKNKWNTEYLPNIKE